MDAFQKGIQKTQKRKDDRVIIHFDYDCFYASVFEAENPALKALPLAVQQKHIIVTCNYEARRRGLYKLQLISEAKKTCPDVVIVLGEDLTRFRDASKALYNFLRSFSWNGKAERLGFDEVFLDVTDIVDYNIGLLNRNDLSHSFFQMSKTDPAVGFAYDASLYAGCTHPTSAGADEDFGDAENEVLAARLKLGSHLAMRMRHLLEENKGYTSTVGISTSKLVSKLVGNVNKPKNQTTLIPPYTGDDPNVSNIIAFLDDHDIGRIPGIGCKLSHKIRTHVLGRPAEFHDGLVYGGTKESVTVKDVRIFPGMGPNLLERVVSGPGSHHDTPRKVWNLINGIDDSEVGQARDVPRQISLEDSYIRLDTLSEVIEELKALSLSLIKRMHLDLLEIDAEPTPGTPDADPEAASKSTEQRWIAHPTTLRLTTRPRAPRNPDGSRSRSFNRISRSGTCPNFLFNLAESDDALAEKLVMESLLPLFKKLHPERSGWNLSLVNIAVTNMVEASGSGKSATGRDIGRMFKQQEEVLKDWRVEDIDMPPDHSPSPDEVETSAEANVAHPNGNGLNTITQEMNAEQVRGSEDLLHPTQNSAYDDGEWDEDDDYLERDDSMCTTCGARMPTFALPAHQRIHEHEGE